MSQLSLTCAGERLLGSELAQGLGYANTKSFFEDSNQPPEKIMETALAECQQKGGIEELLTNALRGPAWWAYIVLRYGPDLGDKRETFLKKATEDPKTAYYTLRFVSDLGNQRSALIAATMKDEGWASSALKHLGTPIADAAINLTAIPNPPVENGWGYNTYFVNQSGKELWVSYNTGQAMSSGSITGPQQLNIDQNVGFGRGGAQITEMRAWTSKPDNWSTNGFFALWSLPQGANGLKSWGFRFNENGLIETEEWYSGGMPDKYPPSNGH